MVLFLQLMTVAICGGFILLVARDTARTNICLARGDVQDLTIMLGAELRRAQGYPEGYRSKHHMRAEAARYVLKRAEARYERVKVRGF
jgi:hypothetical protein